MADLGLAAFQTGVGVAQIIVFIIQTSEQAHHLKEECRKIHAAATTLQSCLANPKGIEGLEASSSLKSLLVEVAGVVAKCKQSNFLKRAWEVAWRQKIPALVKEMMMWSAILNVEVSTKTRSELFGILSGLDSLQSQQATDTSAILEKLSILDELKKIQDDKAAEALGIDFPETNDDLDVRPESSQLLAGSLKFRGPPADAVQVVCEPLNENIMTYGEKGPRHVLIYAKISANTLVHPFYGIANRYSRRWAVMKDLRGSKTLAAAIEANQMPSSTLERISLAHRICTTIDYLHSVEILVKRLSDKTILLSQEGASITPYLTDLEKARLFKENTTGGKYDVRYEAVEMQISPKPPRNVYSDIWSLGIIIWTCVSATIPFNFTEKTSGDINVNLVREAIATNKMPWTQANDGDIHLKRVLGLVASCCNPKPMARPSASEVTSTLWDIMTLPPIDDHIVASTGEEIKARVSGLLDRGSGSTISLDHTDSEILRSLEGKGDPVAAYLIGRAIWNKQMEPDDNVEELLMLVDARQGIERRARSALTHLETAMRADHKGAAKYLMIVHDELAKLYRKQALQYDRLQSLPKELM